MTWLAWLAPLVKWLLSTGLEAWASRPAAPAPTQPVDPIVAEVADERSQLADPADRDALLRALRARATRDRADA